MATKLERDSATFLAWMAMPMVAWDSAVGAAHDNLLFVVQGLATSSAVHATRLAVYLERRLQGCTHVQAVREQNRAAARVRKVLGFTIGPDDVTF